MIVNTGTCLLCGQPGQLDVSDEKLAARMISWRRLPAYRRPFVQNTFPELSPGDREQLMNGSHEACFDAAFPEEEDEPGYFEGVLRHAYVPGEVHHPMHADPLCSECGESKGFGAHDG